MILRCGGWTPPCEPEQGNLTIYQLELYSIVGGLGNLLKVTRERKYIFLFLFILISGAGESELKYRNYDQSPGSAE